MRSKIYAILKPHIPIQEISNVVDEVMEVMPQWIPVSERLPTEEKGLYLVRWPNGGTDPQPFEDAIKHLNHFSSLYWLGPIPTPPKED